MATAYTDTLPKKERHALEEKLLMETNRILESVKSLIPKGGHLSLVAFPDGHMDVNIFSGNLTDDGERAIMVCDAWGSVSGGKLKVHRNE